MKKYGILALVASLFIAQQAGAMFGGGGSSSKVSVTDSEAKLKADLLDAKDKQEVYFEKATKFVQGVGGLVKSSIEDPLDVLPGIRDKFEANLAKLQDATTANAALDAIGALLTQAKQLGGKYTEYINAFLDEVLRYLAASSMISDSSIKNKIEKNADETARVVAELKKSFPSTIKARALGESLKSAGSSLLKGLVEGGTQVGLEVGAGLLPSVTQGLISLITGKSPAQPLTEEQKMQIVTNVKQTLAAVEKIKEALNNAAGAAATELGKAKNIDLDIVMAVKESFKIFADPSYSTAPTNLKFDSLIGASEKLFEVLGMLGRTLKSVNSAGLKFLTSIYGESGDDALAALQAGASKLNKIIDSFNAIYESIKEEIVNAKNKFAATNTTTTTTTTNIGGFQQQQQQTQQSSQQVQLYNPKDSEQQWIEYCKQYPGHEECIKRQQKQQPSGFQQQQITQQLQPKPTKVYDERSSEVMFPVKGATYYLDIKRTQPVVWVW